MLRESVNPIAIEDDETIERRGASGAKIIIGRKFTTKLDVERTNGFVRRQGEWLSQFEDDRIILPRVSHTLSHGYVMETLEVPELPLPTNVMELVNHIITRLSEKLWPLRKPELNIIFSPKSHREYVDKLVNDVCVTGTDGDRRWLTAIMRDFERIVDFSSLHVGLTHGDCIVDNVAYRAVKDSRRSQLVLLDPIPATEALPNLRAVDVGRLVQSAIGYESIRYTRNRGVTSYDDAVSAVLNAYMFRHFKVNEARACLYFAIIHMLRGVRTTDRGTAVRLGLWHLTNELIGVTKEWMR